MGKINVFVVVLIGMLFAVLFVCCEGNTPVEPVVEMTQTSIPTIMPTRTLTQIIEPTITPIFDDLEVRNFQYVDLCGQENKHNIERITSYPGLILKVNKYKPNTFKLTYIDSNQIERVIFENFPMYHSLRISPDYQWIAEKSENEVFIRNLATNEAIDWSWKYDWWCSLSNWLNEDYLLVTDVIDQEPLKYYAYNPFTDEQLPLRVNFPDLYFDVRIPATWPTYDPSLNYVLYVKSDEGYTLVLFDVKNGKEISSTMYQPNSGFDYPKWSHDGQLYYFVQGRSDKNEEWHVFHMLGTVGGNYIELVKIPSDRTAYQINSIQWSPNDKYIALSLNRFEDGTAFQIIDLENERIILSCMMGKQFEMEYITAYMHGPIWSPDSQKVAFQNYGEETGWEIIVFDVETLEYNVIQTKKLVYGWVDVDTGE